MASTRAALAEMLTARVATAAAGMIVVGKAAMALLVAAVRKPAAAVLAGVCKGGVRGPRVARGTAEGRVEK
jgi:hypothetical protein